MELTSKTVYRVGADGKYLGPVLVDPQVIASDSGFVVDHPMPTDLGLLVEVEPPSDLHVWDVDKWVEPESARPEPPAEKLCHQIDLETGLIVEPVIIHPAWIEDFREWRFILPNNVIDTPVPQDAGFWAPKWDSGRRKWVEGGEPVIIDPATNWDDFVNAYTASMVDEVLDHTVNAIALTRLNRLLSRAPNIDFALMVRAWNECVEGLPKDVVGEAFVEEVRSLVATHYLPVTVDDAGKLSR